jgi:hypothetical protein
MLPDSLADNIWMAVVTPGYNLLWSDGRNAFTLDASLRLQRPSEQGVVFNREDPSLSLNWQRNTELTQLSLTGSYLEASTRLTELEDTGQIFADATRRNKSLNAAVARALSERAVFGIDATYSRSEFVPVDGGSAQPQNLQSFESATLGLSHGYEISDSLELLFQASIAQVEPLDAIEGSQFAGGSDFQSLGVGVDWEINDLFGFQATIAQVWVELDNSPRAEADYNGELALTYASERFQWDLTAGRTTAPSGIGGFLENNSVQFSLEHQLSERSRWGASASWRENSGGVRGLNNSFGTGALWVAGDLSERWSVRAAYTYREQDGGLRFATGDSLDDPFDITRGQMVSVTLTYEPNLTLPDNAL